MESAAAATAEAPDHPALDWTFAQRRAAGLAKPGPALAPGELRTIVSQLRQSAQEAPAHVGAVTGLLEPALRAGSGPIYVLDRPRWAQANLQMMRSMIGDVLPGAGSRMGARVTGAQVGLVLALLSTRVLGQYDPYTTTSAGTGRLVLVAPTIVTIQRELGLDQHDFGLWVCLHEQTHALQFQAAPWLADHLRATMRELMAGLADTEQGSARFAQMLKALPKTLAGNDEGNSASALSQAMLSESEQHMLDETVAVMSLLEGHADVVMDEVGPKVLPTVKNIRRKFERRRSGKSGFDVLLRRMLGLDAKLAQYRNGAKFVRAVISDVGHEGFNQVWLRAENLPQAHEIAEPAAWVSRVVR